MVVTKEDVKIERRVENEARKELQELYLALFHVLKINNILHKKRKSIINRSEPTLNDKEKEEFLERLEKSSRLVLDAKMHIPGIKKLSQRIYNDLMDIRGGMKGEENNFLTKSEAEILAKCDDLTNTLTKANALIQAFKNGISRYRTGTTIILQNLLREVESIYQAVIGIVDTLKAIFNLEKQVEVSTKRYANA